MVVPGAEHPMRAKEIMDVLTRAMTAKRRSGFETLSVEDLLPHRLFFIDG